MSLISLEKEPVVGDARLLIESELEPIHTI
jgi:hypothetical protein